MDADALIVGAGPAGATTALNLAPYRRVILLDRRAVPEARIGESMPGAVHRLLRDMGLWDSFRGDGHAPCHGHRSIWGGPDITERDALRDPDGHGWLLDRARFERRLRATAAARGAMLLSPSQPLALEQEADGWRVVVDLAGEMVVVRARTIVDAGGRQSRLLRRFGVRRRTESRLVCRWIGCDGMRFPAGLTHVEAEAEGWWYAARLPQGGSILAFHTDADLPAARAARSAATLLARACTLPLLGRSASVDVPPAPIEGFCPAAGTILDEPVGAGWIAVGDAAISFDPLASQGLFNALYTGLAGAEAIHRHLAGDTQAFAEYAGDLRRIHAAYIAHLASWYGIERRWPESAFWRRRHISG